MSGIALNPRASSSVTAGSMHDLLSGCSFNALLNAIKKLVNCRIGQSLSWIDVLENGSFDHLSNWEYSLIFEQVALMPACSSFTAAAEYKL